MSLPEDGAFRLRDATVPACLADGLDLDADRDGLVRLDLRIEAGRIAEVTPAGGPSAPGDVALGGRMVWPAPADLHTHLDKGHIRPRARNADGRFDTALATVRADREANWSAIDVAARTEFALRCAHAHGTAAIRTHLDSSGKQAAISWPVFAEARERWAGRIALQAVSLATCEDYRGPAGEALADLVAEHGGVLGLVPRMDPDLDDDLDRFFRLAAERGLDVDMHVDESGDPEDRALDRVARAVIRHGFAGAVVAGHCCSLAVQDEATALGTLDRVAEAGMAVVSLPMCNMYLQDRVPDRTPRWRGVTLLHEMRARGIPVAVASDNTRDPFYAYGDLDPHEVFREAVRIAHLDHPFGDWAATLTRTPAAIMGLADTGVLRAGAPADLVVFEGRSFSETLSRPESGRVVLRAGRPIDARPPSYAELDGLFADAAGGAT